jgi:NAD(P)H-hydrate repair Nnr-like enzyme with NAD(P)H-hydrate dehydratase domain
METNDYIKQTDQPLFPDILWNRPLSRHTSGRLLLVGGHSGGFNMIQSVYQFSVAAGIGQCSVVLPDVLRPILAGAPDSHFAPSTQSGSLGKGALALILDMAQEHDAVMLGPDLSANSETTVLAEHLLTSLTRPVILLGDSLIAARYQPEQLLNSPHHLVVADITEVLKLASAKRVPLPISHPDSVLNKLEIIKAITKHSSVSWMIHGRELIVSDGYNISLTPTVSEMEFFRPASAAIAAVFYLQHPKSPFKALTAAAYILRQVRELIAKPNQEPLTSAEIAQAIAKALADSEKDS